MDHRIIHTEDPEPGPGFIATSARGTPSLQANTQHRALDYRPMGLNRPPNQEQSNSGVSPTADLQQHIHGTQAAEPIPGVRDAHRVQEAQAAFSANSEIIATTPRKTVWGGENPPSAPPEPQGLNEEPQDQAWTPRLALGTINVHQVGATEAARRHMLQWDRIYEFNEAQNPGSLQIVDRHRREARRVYEELLMSRRDEGSLRQRDSPSYQNERIRARTALLFKTLLEAPEEGCEPMKANITAALKGYNTGLIGFSENYTLIYAGHIVDTTCSTYATFTSDRQERLDKYLEEYGPGYLWWEPPLATGRDRVLAKKSTGLILDREDESFSTEDQQAHRFQDDASHYKVPMGFKRDDSISRRLTSRRKKSVVAKETHPESVTAAKRKRENTEKGQQESEKSKHRKLDTREGASARQGAQHVTAASSSFDQGHSATTTPRGVQHDTDQKESAPTIFFDMLLDSGAELPILLHDDFELLGYSKQDMNAASVVELNAAAGQTCTALCFELRVGLELEGSRSSAAESWTDKVAYSEARFFPSRVIKLPATVKTPAYGAFSGDRLSGMLPFLAYYMASAPGNGKLCLGEKRAEVLSTHNLPAGLKYDPFDNPFTKNRVRRQEVIAKIHKLGGETRGLRKVILETDMEDGRKLVDVDVIGEGSEEFTSSIGIIDKCGDLIHSWNQGHGR